MKIIFDIDGTLTNYNDFIESKAIPFIISRFHLEVINKNALEIEEIFDIKEHDFNNIIEIFWHKYFFSFFTLSFRKNIKHFFKTIKKQKHTFEIHTSRAYSYGNNCKNIFVRIMTWIQFLINGILVNPANMFFYKDDNEKINGIIKSNPNLIFDDKPEIISKLLSKNFKIICVKGNHNQQITENKNIQLINAFDFDELNIALKNLFGTTNLRYYNREAKSNYFFNYLRLLRPFILLKFKPIILNENNIYTGVSTGVVYAPNHISTLDPVIITAILNTHIHWAALLRFFEGKDSIFNNSKIPILCKITSKSFYMLDYFPIERKSDNENANNFMSIKDMNNYLKIKSKVGIFGEGTTKKLPKSDFGHFDKSFVMLAQRNNSMVQPITVSWIKCKKVKSKVVVNFGKPFLASNMNTDEAMNLFMDIQKFNLQENQKIINNIMEEKENGK